MKIKLVGGLDVSKSPLLQLALAFAEGEMTAGAFQDRYFDLDKTARWKITDEGYPGDAAGILEGNFWCVADAYSPRIAPDAVSNCWDGVNENETRARARLFLTYGTDKANEVLERYRQNAVRFFQEEGAVR